MAKQKGKTSKTEAPKEVKEVKKTEVKAEKPSDHLVKLSPAEQQAENLIDLHRQTREWLAVGGAIQAGYQQNRASGNAKIIRDLIKVTRSRRKDWR